MSQYIRYSILPITEVVGWIDAMRGEEKLKKEVSINNVLYKFGVTSKRLRAFADHFGKHGSLACTNCGYEAKFFAVEDFTRNSKMSPHINLYGDADVLFTHDHTVARAMGGADDSQNIQVMCFPCNSRKGSVEGKIVEQMRAVGLLPKKKNKPKTKSKGKK